MGVAAVERDMGILRTLRLELRPLCGGDIAHVSALNADPRVMASLGGPLSRDASQAWLDRQIEHLIEHGYARYWVTCGGTFVGLVGLSRTDFDCGLVSGVKSHGGSCSNIGTADTPRKPRVP